jgi:acyl-coenzyme A synthetase/AMP-(fatty) acid ligase
MHRSTRTARVPDRCAAAVGFECHPVRPRALLDRRRSRNGFVDPCHRRSDRFHASGVEVEPDDPLSISFTSGSSGTPKAVVHSHRNAVGNGLRVAAVIDISTADRLLAVSRFQYTASAASMYAALLSGSALCLYELATRGATPFQLFVSETQITVAQVTPALQGALVRNAPDAGFPSVRMVMLGGSRVDMSQLRALQAAFPSARFMCRYNTAETNWVAGLVVDPRTSSFDGAVPLGSPVPWVDVWILGERGHDVAVGEVGELAIRGDFLALGYWATRCCSALRGRRPIASDTVRVTSDGDHSSEGSFSIVDLAGDHYGFIHGRHLRVTAAAMSEWLAALDRRSATAAARLTH